MFPFYFPAPLRISDTSRPADHLTTNRLCEVSVPTKRKADQENLSTETQNRAAKAALICPNHDDKRTFDEGSSDGDGMHKILIRIDRLSIF